MRICSWLLFAAVAILLSARASAGDDERGTETAASGGPIKGVGGSVSKLQETARLLPIFIASQSRGNSRTARARDN